MKTLLILAAVVLSMGVATEAQACRGRLLGRVMTRVKERRVRPAAMAWRFVQRVRPGIVFKK